jgi:hypothetical protein
MYHPNPEVLNYRIESTTRRSVGQNEKETREFLGASSLRKSPQTRHRAKQIEKERRGKLRVTEDRHGLVNS